RTQSQDSHSGDDSDNDDDDDEGTWVRSQSPSTSVSQLAANFAQRVGSLMTPVVSAKALPTDAELEAEAVRERDRSRREAERILTREAEERRKMEERVLAMMGPSPPPTRPRSNTLPNPPPPATLGKEGGTSWWSAAKNRLTPTKEKEALTPAQQIIHEVKTRDKEKKITKSRDKTRPPSTPGDTSDLNLKIPPGGPQPRTSSPTSPSPNKTPVRLSPQPATRPSVNLSPISLQRGPSPGGSPAREQPPIYATFTPSGTLDVPGTLLVIAKRFEKLERWSVSHVRALEERMGDVERWLVERENERGKEDDQDKQDAHPPESELGTLRDEVVELQSRIGELGREMARFATSPAALSDSPVPGTAPFTEYPIPQEPTSTVSLVGKTMATPRRVPSLTARESTSPPLARVGTHRTGTRLPYPTGDYASPDAFISPTHTPASSPPPTSRPTSMVISGLTSPLGTPGSMSPPARAMSPMPSGLPPSGLQTLARGSVSPSPMPAGRKRYTVALGGPIVPPPEIETEYEREREKTATGTAYFSSTTESSEEDDDDMSETVGRKAASRTMAAVRLTSGSETNLRNTPSPGSRARAQSTYGSAVSVNALQCNQVQGKHRFRSQSTDFRSESTFGTDTHPSKFVDPLVLRRQSKSEKGKESKPLVGPGKKVPVGQLVAFFDSERRN
ncbi:hypothetical protein J3A83DRAFT_4093118, partial [Scleroderma citrinum]